MSLCVYVWKRDREREKWQDNSKTFYIEIQRTKNSQNNLEKKAERCTLSDINIYYKSLVRQCGTGTRIKQWNKTESYGHVRQR